MELNVRFRFNKLTGEVEEFVVEAPGDDLPGADHDREHDRQAAELARLIDRHARVTEVPGATPAAPAEALPVDPEGPTRETQRGGT